MNSPLRNPANLIRQFDGPLTRELTRSPAKFGLGQLPSRLHPQAVTRSVCGFCSTGCSLDVHLHDDGAINVTPSVDYPVNRGVACPKGWESLAVLKSADRATTPLLRNAHGKLATVDWDTALGQFCDQFQRIQSEFGADSVAFLSTGQIPTEEMALLGSLTKFGMGLIHGDGNTRQCMATAATAYKESFGFDAPPYTYHDFEQSDVIVLVGSNLCIAHPIMWERVARNPHHPAIVVVDPRTTETAAAATHHLAIRPKSDLTLFYGIANLLIERGAVDRSFIERSTNDFESFCEHVRPYSVQAVAAETGLSATDIESFATLIEQGKRVSFWWTMGVNQSYQGVRTAQSLINLALMTGNIGRPGTGANSITGQCNAMGSRLFSNTTSLLGGRDFQNEEHRRQVAEILDISVEHIPSTNSWPYHKILDEIDSGRIKGLWIVGTNPAHSWIDQAVGKSRLEKLEFLVVQDMYTSTETAEVADLILPAAGWGEKEGTFINSERRLSVTRRVSRAPGDALSDFLIFRLIAERWGCGELFRQWSSPEACFDLMRELSRGLPCDISGIDGYTMLTERGGIQWPFVEVSETTCTVDNVTDNRVTDNRVTDNKVTGDASTNAAPEATYPETERRLFENGEFYHADHKAKFCFGNARSLPSKTDSDYPFLLITGRGSVAQWHTQTRTAKSSVLRTLYANQSYVEVHPDDATAQGIVEGGRVLVESLFGSLRTTAVVSTSVPHGIAFIPMHYADTNQLTQPHFDPYSHQPSYKNTAVRIVPASN